MVYQKWDQQDIYTHLSKLKLSAMSPRVPLLCRCQNLRYIHDNSVPLPHMQGYVPSSAPTAQRIIAAMSIRSGSDLFVNLPEKKIIKIRQLNPEKRSLGLWKNKRIFHTKAKFIEILVF